MGHPREAIWKAIGWIFFKANLFMGHFAWAALLNEFITQKTNVFEDALSLVNNYLASLREFKPTVPTDKESLPQKFLEIGEAIAGRRQCHVCPRGGGGETTGLGAQHDEPYRD
jgi:hypothetical protein